jgi:hypothetical protein
MIACKFRETDGSIFFFFFFFCFYVFYDIFFKYREGNHFKEAGGSALSTVIFFSQTKKKYRSIFFINCFNYF